MKHLTMVLCAALLLVAPAHAGLFKNSVDLADLAQVPAEELDSLKDTEFAVFLAQVRLNTSKAAERRAAGGLKTAGRMIDAESLDLKAAKAEAKAAKANADDERLNAAEVLTSSAEQDLETAKKLRKWKQEELQAREAEVSRDKSGLDVAEARSDVARARLLAKHDTAAADKYKIGDMEKSLQKREKEHEATGRKAAERVAKLEKARAEYERLAKNLGFVDEES